MNKRVHQIAKERGLPSKELLEKLRAAGVEVKAASSNVDEAVVLRVLGDGGAPGEPDGADAQAPQAPARQAKTAPAASATSKAAPDGGAAETARRPSAEPPHKRPTRDSLQGERAPGAAGGRRRVVIDSQASRRAPSGAPAPSSQPPRRQRRGRRRRAVYDEEAESRPAASRTALAEPDP